MKRPPISRQIRDLHSNRRDRMARKRRLAEHKATLATWKKLLGENEQAGYIEEAKRLKVKIRTLEQQIRYIGSDI